MTKKIDKDKYKDKDNDKDKDKDNDKDKDKVILRTPPKSNPRDNWEPEFMTIFVTWQLIVTLDSIRNSCDVLYYPHPALVKWESDYNCRPDSHKIAF